MAPIAKIVAGTTMKYVKAASPTRTRTTSIPTQIAQIMNTKPHPRRHNPARKTAHANPTNAITPKKMYRPTGSVFAPTGSLSLGPFESKLYARVGAGDFRSGGEATQPPCQR